MLKPNNVTRFKTNAIIIRRQVEQIVEQKLVDQDCEIKELRELAEFYAKRPQWDYGHKAREVLARYGSNEWVGK